jgi:D-alanine-D-alanine ligase
MALARSGAHPIAIPADCRFPAALKEGRFDFVFNIAEGIGRRCREAVPAAICEFIGIPFTGSDALTLAVTLDKAIARRIVSPDVPVAQGVLIEDVADEIRLAELRYPVVVKPNDEGSSKGISSGSLCRDFSSAVDQSRWLRSHYGSPALVEEFLPGAEVTVGVLGNGRTAFAAGMMEIAAADDRAEPFLYSVEVKRNFRSSVRYYEPPRLPERSLHQLTEYALTAYRLLGCRDFARIDFRLDAEGQARFLECNPLPGLNPDTSDLVILTHGVIAYEDLVCGILSDAAARWGIECDGFRPTSRARLPVPH